MEKKPGKKPGNGSSGDAGTVAIILVVVVVLVFIGLATGIINLRL